MALLLMAGLAGLLLGHIYVDEGQVISQVLIVTITLLLAAGLCASDPVDPAFRPHRCGVTGDEPVHSGNGCDDDLFCTVMGLLTGWPLLLLAIVSGTTKLIVMWPFRWVRISPQARLIREQQVVVQ